MGNVSKITWSDEEITFLKENYSKMTCKQLSELLQKPHSSVRHKKKLLNLCKGRGYWLGKSSYSVIDDYFDRITEKSAYILGYLVADGHIATNKRHRLAIGLNKRDIWFLELIRDEISPDAKITYYEKNDSVNLYISNYKLIESLSRVGLDHDKNRASEIINIIPEKMIRHFIRGFFDGDGCFSFQNRVRGKYKSTEGKVSFVNLDYNLLQNITKFLDYGTVKKTRNHYIAAFSSLQDIQRYYHLIYDNSTVYLNRKFNKFNDYFKHKGLK